MDEKYAPIFAITNPQQGLSAADKLAQQLAERQQAALDQQRQYQQGLQQELESVQKSRMPDLTGLFLAGDMLTGGQTNYAPVAQRMAQQGRQEELLLRQMLGQSQRQTSQSEMDALQQQLGLAKSLGLEAFKQQGKLDYAQTAGDINKEIAMLKSQIKDNPDSLDAQLKQARVNFLNKKMGEMETKKSKMSETKVTSGQVLLDEIDEAIGMTQEGGATGWNALYSNIPGTRAKKMRALLDSIKGTVAVDRLLDIKASGAGLGQVPQSQLDMLASLMGTLDQQLDDAMLSRNLSRIKDIYSDIVAKEGGDPLKLVKKRKEGEGGQTQDYDWENMSLEEIEAIGR